MNERTGTTARAGDDLLPIGRFARLTGLSIGALRHYDELDLLRPADVDRFTGYRRYRREQLEAGRTISRLRDLEVPIEEIRELLAADDPADRRRRIEAHARRLQARVDRLVHVLHTTRQLSREGSHPMTDRETATAEVPPSTDPRATSGSDTVLATPPGDLLDAETHRRLGKALYNHTWTLIEEANRTPAQDEEMVLATHASAWHWAHAGGTLANGARSQWQIARVYATLGRGEAALWHARRCLDLAQAATNAGVADDWDVPAALEALARAQAVAGDVAGAAATLKRARSALEAIADPEDRQLIEQDLASIPT